MQTLKVPVTSANDSGQDPPYSWSLYEKGLRPALNRKIHKWTRRPLRSSRRLCGSQPHLCPVPLCPPCPARTANLRDTLHFLEKGALGLQEQELLKPLVFRGLQRAWWVITMVVVSAAPQGPQHSTRNFRGLLRRLKRCSQPKSCVSWANSQH